MPLFLIRSLLNSFKKFYSKETFFLLFIGLSVLVVSLIRYMTHSEFWSIYYSKFLLSPGNFQESLFSKFIFHLLLNWIHWLPLENVAHLLIAKLTFGFVGVGILALTYKILRLRLNPLPSLFVLLYLYLNPLTFWELPQAKADIACMLLILAATYSGLTGKKHKTLFFIVLSFFATPKSILFIPLCIGILYSHKKENFIWKPKYNLWLVRMLIVAFVLLFSFSGSLNSYKMAFGYFIKLLKDGFEKGFYRGENSYFIQLFLIYVFPSLVIFYLLIKYFVKLPIIDPSKRTTFYSVLIWSLLCITIYPLKHPYFLVVFFFMNTLLFVNSSNPKCVESIISKLDLSKNKAKIFFILIIFPLAGAVHSSFYNIGLEQLKMISKIDAWIQYNKQIRIADATGILPRANNVPQFIDYFDDIATNYFMKSIASNPPDLILMTTKVFYKYHLYSYLIQKNYVYVSRYILLKRIELSDAEVVIGKNISKKLKESYRLEPTVVSFRAHSRIDKNRPIEATCIDTGIQKFDWPIDEVESCTRFSFKTFDLNKIKQSMEVYPVPFASKSEKIFDRLPEITNFKDFGTLDEFITEFQ